MSGKISERKKRIEALMDLEEDSSVARKTQIESITLAIKKLQDKFKGRKVECWKLTVLVYTM